MLCGIGWLAVYSVPHRKDYCIYLENFLSPLPKSKIVFFLQRNGCEITFSSELCPHICFALLLGSSCVEWQYQHLPQGGAQALDAILNGWWDSTAIVKWLLLYPGPENKLSSCHFYTVPPCEGLSIYLKGGEPQKWCQIRGCLGGTVQGARIQELAWPR